MDDAAATDGGLLAGQTSRIRVWERATGAIRTVQVSRSRRYEAPNWTKDDRLLVNGDGRLWLLPADGSGAPEAIPAVGLPEANNDHILSPDGRTVFASAQDWHIWALPLEGGAARRVTSDDGAMHFLHGVSPDGARLGYVRLDPEGENWWASATIHTIGVDGDDDVAVTTDPGPADGCAWTPDGEWIVFNTEQFSQTPGHAQLARVRPDGTELEQLTFDDRVNWFPHVAPTGDVAVYLSYPPGTVGHPADLPVELRLVAVDDWTRPTTIVAVHGGQGTINVPSWAPDGSAFAFVDYPIEDASEP
ncbi:WD40-like Beta Propeller Repeat [Microbacterium azadirachtae]|uniref:WD40-like Beta Propeller Repeat n=1 Tax=Microbacterium azadirachtae TaxID=582680 RepID=A0A1I6GBR7_9MICO|nr:PD40 domain-containing protein [Microbacterium azadirachtae]SFR39654.1 WD40-like Beta Propeller Repeat [Microbacterium azadirachtae]